MFWIECVVPVVGRRVHRDSGLIRGTIQWHKSRPGIGLLPLEIKTKPQNPKNPRHHKHAQDIDYEVGIGPDKKYPVPSSFTLS